MESFLLREASAADSPELAALDRVSPQEGTVLLAASPRPGVDFLDFVRSNGHPEAKGYVALDPAGGKAAGFVFVEVERANLNGKTTPCAYLFHLRVHPSYRRRGVGRALVAHAERATASLGAELFWAGVVQGNDASSALFRGCGYRPASRVPFKVLPTLWPGLWGAKETGSLLQRPATPADAPAIDQLKEAFWADHQLWAKRRYLLATQGYVSTDAAGAFLAFADCFEHYQVGEGRLLGFKGLPGPINAALASLMRPLSVRLVFVRDLCFVDPHAAAGLIGWLARRYRGEADLLVVGGDSGSKSRAVLRAVPGLGGGVDILVKSDTLISNRDRPFHMVLG